MSRFLLFTPIGPSPPIEAPSLEVMADLADALCLADLGPVTITVQDTPLAAPRPLRAADLAGLELTPPAWPLAADSESGPVGH